MHLLQGTRPNLVEKFPKSWTTAKKFKENQQKDANMTCLAVLWPQIAHFTITVFVCILSIDIEML